MPVALGDLPSLAPIPNGRCQIVTGKTGADKWVDPGHNGLRLDDGGGGWMAIYYTPTYRCLWNVRANMIYSGVPGQMGGLWQRFDYMIMLTPADLDGQTQGHVRPMSIYDANTVGWRDAACSALFRLEAGVLYQAYLASGYASGGVGKWYAGPEYARIIGRVVGEGAIS